MGNQMQSAFEKAGQAAGENLAESVNDALDKLAAQIEKLPTVDGITENGDNNTNDAAEVSKEVPEEPTVTVEELRDQLNDQNATIDKLVKILGDMVTKYGAQVSDEPTNNNDPFGGNDQENGEPQADLNSLTLGSM